MMTVQGLTKRYARTIAVDNVSFEVTKGEIVGFVGPSGGGKTTTMRVLTCFLPPTSGTATVAGFDVLEAPMEVKRRIGYLPEAPPLYLEMRTAEYLTFVGRLKGLSGVDLEQRVDAVCDRCAVGDVKNKLLGKLSRSEEHTSELQSHLNLVCRLLPEKKTTRISIYPQSPICAS